MELRLCPWGFDLPCVEYRPNGLIGLQPLFCSFSAIMLSVGIFAERDTHQGFDVGVLLLPTPLKKNKDIVK
jgi:hypothetical protein